MDDELQTLEMELKQLRPAQPAPALVCRIEGELVVSRRAVWRVPWLWGIALPVAAAVAVLVLQPWRKPDAARAPTEGQRGVAAIPAEPALKPVAMENLLYSAQDEGIVTLTDGTPARRERLQYVDTIIWRNPRTNASLKWTVPREEVRVVPVSFQ